MILSVTSLMKSHMRKFTANSYRDFNVISLCEFTESKAQCQCEGLSDTSMSAMLRHGEYNFVIWEVRMMKINVTHIILS